MLPPELIDKAGLRLIGEIAKLSKGEARERLSQLQYSEEEILALLTLCRPEKVIQAQQIGYYEKRRRCFAACWLLGASWGQISALYNISRQAVMAAANKVLKDERLRLADRCTYERLSEYNTQYWTLDADNELDPSWTPLQLANKLLLTERDDD